MSYYWTNTKVLDKYPTIWKGILKNENIDNKWILPEQLRELDDLFVEILERNFHLDLDENNIHISLCQDSPLYYNEFEAKIINMLKEIEKQYHVKIGEGEFYLWECKPMANTIKYSIYKQNGKFKIKKNVHNWEKN
jgi:hypothetical protein